MRGNFCLLLFAIVFLYNCKSVPTGNSVYNNREGIEQIGEYGAKLEQGIGELQKGSEAAIVSVGRIERGLYSFDEQLSGIKDIIQAVKARGRYYYNTATGEIERIPD